MGSRTSTVKSVRNFSSLAVVAGVAWISVVVGAFAQPARPTCWPVNHNGAHIGNLYVTNYFNVPGGGGMEAIFNAVNGYNVGNLHFIQFVLNAGFQPLPPPWVDPPNGGYGPGDPADNEPWYWDNNFPASGPDYQENRYRGNNFINIIDYPGGANFTDFVTHLVVQDGRNITPLACFQWGYNNVNGNTVVWPRTPNRVNYDPNLTNVLRNQFPGWNVIPPTVAVVNPKDPNKDVDPWGQGGDNNDNNNNPDNNPDNDVNNGIDIDGNNNVEGFYGKFAASRSGPLDNQAGGCSTSTGGATSGTGLLVLCGLWAVVIVRVRRRRDSTPRD